jgi:hypothetical protein
MQLVPRSIQVIQLELVFPFPLELFVGRNIGKSGFVG